MGDTWRVTTTSGMLASSIQQPSAELRWDNGKLQQRWLIKHLNGNTVMSTETEWRNVPGDDGRTVNALMPATPTDPA